MWGLPLCFQTRFSVQRLPGRSELQRNAIIVLLGVVYKTKENFELRERMMWMEEICNEEHIVIYEGCLIR